MMHSTTPVGATLRDRYYEVEHYKRFPVDTEGFEDAVSVVRERYRDHPDHPACVVDLCWDLRWEPGAQGGACGVTGMIERMRVQHLDEAHWDRVRKHADPLPFGKAEVYVRALPSKQCSYSPDRQSASGTCHKPAVSAVETTANGNRMWRCQGHEGRIDYLNPGKIRLRVLVDADSVDPAFHVRTGPRLPAVPAEPEPTEFDLAYAKYQRERAEYDTRVRAARRDALEAWSASDSTLSDNLADTEAIRKWLVHGDYSHVMNPLSDKIAKWDDARYALERQVTLARRAGVPADLGAEPVPPPPEYVVVEREIHEQFVQCSYPMREPMVAMSDCCRRRATSQVKTGDNWLHRCTDHEGLVRGTDVGAVRTSSRVRVLA